MADNWSDRMVLANSRDKASISADAVAVLVAYSSAKSATRSLIVSIVEDLIWLATRVWVVKSVVVTSVAVRVSVVMVSACKSPSTFRLDSITISPLSASGEIKLVVSLSASVVGLKKSGRSARISSTALVM